MIWSGMMPKYHAHGNPGGKQTTGYWEDRSDLLDPTDRFGFGGTSYPVFIW
jgi:hypothetical protein